MLPACALAKRGQHPHVTAGRKELNPAAHARASGGNAWRDGGAVPSMRAVPNRLHAWSRCQALLLLQGVQLCSGREFSRHALNTPAHLGCIHIDGLAGASILRLNSTVGRRSRRLRSASGASRLLCCRLCCRLLHRLIHCLLNCLLCRCRSLSLCRRGLGLHREARLLYRQCSRLWRLWLVAATGQSVGQRGSTHQPAGQQPHIDWEGGVQQPAVPVAAAAAWRTTPAACSCCRPG